MSEQAVDYLSESPPRCYYCGEPAGSVDHVVPQSMLEMLRIMGDDAVSSVLARHGRRMTVPCCMECNSVLGNKYFDTLEKRKAHLKQRMRQRYKKILRMPDWSDRELGQLGGRLQEHVISALVKRDIILQRLRY
jgi:hypothetical protein